MRTCNTCDSTRIYWFRLDSDWGTGGDLTRLNPDEAYLSNDPDMRTDIDLDGLWCMNCQSFT